MKNRGIGLGVWLRGVLLFICCVWIVSLALNSRPAFAQGANTPTSPRPQSPVTHDFQQVVDRASERIYEHAAAWTGTWGQKTVLGIELWRYTAMLVLLLLTFTLARASRWFVEKYAQRLTAKTRWEADDLLFSMAGRPVSLFVAALGLYVATLPVLVRFSPAIRSGFGRICLAVAVASIFWYAWRVVDVIDRFLRNMAARTSNDIDDTFADIVRKTLRVFIFIVAVLFIGQSVLNLNITALIASAGIAGVAVAFAAQDTIANFFGSFMLLLDRPFRVGERVVVNGADGVVETLGFRSTRIRTLDGHLVSIPNKQVADTKIENIGRRPYIRRMTTFGVTYDTPPEKIEEAVRIIREVLDAHGHMHPDFPPRVHFHEYGDWSLNIIMIAWFVPADYWEYLRWCEEVNLDIMRRFNAAGIEFAFPTNTTYLAYDENRELIVSTRPAPPPDPPDPSSQRPPTESAQ